MWQSFNIATTYQILAFLRLVDQANTIWDLARDRNHLLDWEHAYESIFSTEISRKIYSLGFKLDYYDPDTSYEEDVCAYMLALNEKARPYRELLDKLVALGVR